MERKLKVLVCCERSQTIVKAFRKLGHYAYSCDLQDSYGDYPERHFKCNMFDLLSSVSLQWDLIIIHPPCTFLSKVSAPHFDILKHGAKKVYARIAERKKAIEFFKRCQKINCKYIVIENPIPFKLVTDQVGKYSQIVQPYFFGESFSKATCLWLKNLPLLQPTNIVDKGKMIKTKNGTNADWYFKLQPGEHRSTIRSKTFEGMANAIALQYSEYILKQKSYELRTLSSH